MSQVLSPVTIPTLAKLLCFPRAFGKQPHRTEKNLSVVNPVRGLNYNAELLSLFIIESKNSSKDCVGFRKQPSTAQQIPAERITMREYKEKISFGRCLLSFSPKTVNK